MERIHPEETRTAEPEILTPLTFVQVESCADIDARLAAILEALEECSRQKSLISPGYLRRDKISNGCQQDDYGRPIRLVEGNSSCYHMHTREYESATPALVVTKGTYGDYSFNGQSSGKAQMAVTYWLRPALLLNGQELESARERSVREICAKYAKDSLKYAYILEYELASRTRSESGTDRIIRKHISAHFRNGEAVEASILDRVGENRQASELIIMRNRLGELSQEIRHPPAFA
ncbi:MAG: hypothetical protein F4X83_00190 [Chloroflexi bacterium]|nr:hypothetical protein [Chloroflexota bacterium]